MTNKQTARDFIMEHSRGRSGMSELSRVDAEGQRTSFGGAMPAPAPAADQCESMGIVEATALLRRSHADMGRVLDSFDSSMAQNVSVSSEVEAGSAVRLDLTNAPNGRMDPIAYEEPVPDMVVPRGYVMSNSIVQDPQFGPTAEQGGATLLRGKRGGARYVLGCAHVHAVMDEDTGEFAPSGTEHTFSIRPTSRHAQPLRFHSNEIYIHEEYEGGLGSYRSDLSLAVLPEAVDDAHAISRHDMSLHAVQPGELLMYCGMGAKEENGNIHQYLHRGTMRATEYAKSHITKLRPENDNFEQGFSGGPMYSKREADMGAWSGVISHYLRGDAYQFFIIPPTIALPWADALISEIEAREFGASA